MSKAVEVETPATRPMKAPKTPRKAAKKAKGKAKAGNGAKGKAKATRTRDPVKLDQFGFRLGSLKARAAAMYAAKKGATLAEVKEALESTQFNLITELEGKGFAVERNEATSDAGRKVTRYKIVAK